ncbi:MAG: cell filamentation protein Fic, partial [Gemmatimonadota bacterium]|nr:cell filamentation protein Fic [Gemmatimonadota bacterium]
MNSLDPTFLDAIRLNPADAATLTALGAFRGRQELFQRQTPEILGALRDAAVVESTESSNRIEGVTAPTDRIEALVLKNSTPRDRSEQEIAGYRDALELIHHSAEEMPLTINVILQLHTMLYRYAGGQGGRWKMAPNEIVERDA